MMVFPLSFGVRLDLSWHDILIVVRECNGHTIPLAQTSTRSSED